MFLLQPISLIGCPFHYLVIRLLLIYCIIPHPHTLTFGFWDVLHLLVIQVELMINLPIEDPLVCLLAIPLTKKATNCMTSLLKSVLLVEMSGSLSIFFPISVFLTPLLHLLPIPLLLLLAPLLMSIPSLTPLLLLLVQVLLLLQLLNLYSPSEGPLVPQQNPHGTLTMPCSIIILPPPTQPTKIHSTIDTSVSSAYSCFLTHSLQTKDPMHFRQAVTHPHWVEVMNEELHSLELNHT